LSELIKWFEKRREAKALTMIQQHLALTSSIVEDLEKALSALVKNDVEEMSACIDRVAKNEREAGVKECAFLLRECVNKMMTKPEEALQAADAVEREEERVDNLHEKARRLLGKEKMPNAGIAVLVSQLFEALEMIADSCEDACDHVRVIMVRR
jgi:uncharacterized protein Yka (UPF0111/DUF47 family)